MSRKPPIKRMRVFAGPNGSGKSTIIKEIAKVVRTGIFINADEIEKAGRNNKFINLGDYGLTSTPDTFTDYYNQSTLLAKGLAEGKQIDLSFSNNVITVGEKTNSYEAAFIADFLRTQLIAKGETFTFETVMSHPSKLDTLRIAQQASYKNYLYFVSTEAVEINIKRVEERVAKGGHYVDPQKIRDRYVRTMDLVSQMIPHCHRCFIFDNSLETYRLILEIIDGSNICIHTDDEIPAWVDRYVLQKLGV